MSGSTMIKTDSLAKEPLVNQNRETRLFSMDTLQADSPR